MSNRSNYLIVVNSESLAIPFHHQQEFFRIFGNFSEAIFNFLNQFLGIFKAIFNFLNKKNVFNHALI